MEEQETREYLGEVLSQFYGEYRVWGRLIEVMAEVDTLCALSVISYGTPEMSRPLL